MNSGSVSAVVLVAIISISTCPTSIFAGLPTRVPQNHRDNLLRSNRWRSEFFFRSGRHKRTRLSTYYNPKLSSWQNSEQGTLRTLKKRATHWLQSLNLHSNHNISEHLEINSGYGYSRTDTLFKNSEIAVISAEPSPEESFEAAPTPTKSPSIAPTPTPSPQPRFIGRRFHISSEGHMAAMLRREDKFLNASETIQNFARYVETSLVNFLRNNSERPPKQPLNPCNTDGDTFRMNMWYWFEQRNLPSLEFDCITELAGTVSFENETEDGDYTYSTRQLLEAFQAREAALVENRYRIADVILGNWTEPDIARAYQFDTASERCKIYHEGGVKVANKWYLFTSILNKPMDEYLPLFERQILTEVLHVSENRSLIPLRFGAQRRPNKTDKDQTHTWINDTTTTLFSDIGGTYLARFEDIYPEEIPALVSAMEESNLWIQQSQDAVTLSSLAILIFPVFLNLVPIALLAHVKTLTMLLYTVMSDVVTVVPLGIKGLELINIEKRRNIASTIRITSFSNGTETERAAMQMWVAECKVNQGVHTLGVAFLTIAVVSLVVGVSLEFLARAYMTKRRLKRRLFQLEHEPLLADSAVADSDLQATVGAVDSARRSDSTNRIRRNGGPEIDRRNTQSDYSDSI